MESQESLWSSTVARQRYPTLETDGEFFDVAIVGGGITGITAAALLAAEGKKVATLEARQIGSGVTRGTSAHVTAALDTRYYEIEKDFGREGAALAADSSTGAIRQIELFVQRLGLDCELARVPGYLFTEKPDRVDELEREFAAAGRAGLAVERTALPLPLTSLPALKFADQAEFHPLKYLFGLAERAAGAGARIFEEARVIMAELARRPAPPQTQAPPATSGASE